VLLPYPPSSLSVESYVFWFLNFLLRVLKIFTKPPVSTMNFFQRHHDLRKQGTYAATNSESDGEKQKFLRDNLLSRLAMAAIGVNFICK
jgi:hypothetical protein